MDGLVGLMVLASIRRRCMLYIENIYLCVYLGDEDDSLSNAASISIRLINILFDSLKMCSVCVTLLTILQIVKKRKSTRARQRWFEEKYICNLQWNFLTFHRITKFSRLSSDYDWEYDIRVFFNMFRFNSNLLLIFPCFKNAWIFLVPRAIFEILNICEFALIILLKQFLIHT